MHTWPLQQPTSELSQVLDRVEQQGTQIITRAGVETAVIVPIEEWRRQHPTPAAASKRSLLELLQSGPDFEIPVPPRRNWKMREPVEF